MNDCEVDETDLNEKYQWGTLIKKKKTCVVQAVNVPFWKCAQMKC